MSVIQNRGAFLRRLTAGGSFTEAQAEVLADALEGELGQPATRGDLVQIRGELTANHAGLHADLLKLQAELKGDNAVLRAELKGDIAELRAEVKGLAASLTERMDRIADRTLIRVTIAMATLFGLAIAVLRLTGPMP